MHQRNQHILIDKYLDMYRSAYNMLHDTADVEDALQESIAITLARPWLRDPYLYCCRVLYHQCLHTLRRRARMVPIETCTIDLIPDDTESIRHEERAWLLWQQRETLPPHLRQVLDMHFEQRMTMQQIADATGKPLTTVRKLLSMSYGKLRKSMAKTHLIE